MKITKRQLAAYVEAHGFNASPVSVWPRLNKAAEGGIQHFVSVDNGAYYAELWGRDGSYYAVTGAGVYQMPGLAKGAKLSEALDVFLEKVVGKRQDGVPLSAVRKAVVDAEAEVTELTKQVPTPPSKRRRPAPVRSSLPDDWKAPPRPTPAGGRTGTSSKPYSGPGNAAAARARGIEKHDAPQEHGPHPHGGPPTAPPNWKPKKTVGGQSSTQRELTRHFASPTPAPITKEGPAHDPSQCAECALERERKRPKPIMKDAGIPKPKASTPPVSPPTTPASPKSVSSRREPHTEFSPQSTPQGPRGTGSRGGYPPKKTHAQYRGSPTVRDRRELEKENIPSSIPVSTEPVAKAEPATSKPIPGGDTPHGGQVHGHLGEGGVTHSHTYGTHATAKPLSMKPKPEIRTPGPYGSGYSEHERRFGHAAGDLRRAAPADLKTMTHWHGEHQHTHPNEGPHSHGSDAVVVTPPVRKDVELNDLQYLAKSREAMVDMVNKTALIIEKDRTYLKPEPTRQENIVTKLDKALAVAEGVEIGMAQAMSQAELDKKQTHKPTIPRGASHPGHKPHGQVKPRQQRGTAHGQRVAKQSFASSPADPKRGELPKPPKTTPEHGLGEGWQHSHGSASNRWSHGHAFGAHANRRGSTVKKPKMDECESTLKKASDELALMPTPFKERRKETHERARTAQRLQSQRDKTHGDIERRREKKLNKQHPGEYPEEWGPKMLYEKIAEEAADIEKLIKAGCPQGQHKHAPYDYCHPSDRKHHGYTDEKPSGPMDEVHGVLDAAIVEAKGMGADGMAVALELVKGKLDPEARPDQVVQQLMSVANSYTEAAKQGATSPNMRMRAQAMGYKKVADTLRRAAKKLAAPQATVEPTNQLADSFDKLMERAAAHDAKGLVAVLRQAQGKVADDPEGVRRSMASLAGVYDRKSQQHKRTPDQKLRYRSLATLARMAANAIMVDRAVESSEGKSRGS